MKIKNQRTCIICKKKFNKDKLIRFVIINNELILDKENKIKSRGYYISNSKEIINKACELKIFTKKFKVNNELNILKKILNN